MNMCRLSLLLMLAAGLGGCGDVMRGAAPLPDGLSIRQVGGIDRDAPFAVSRSGLFAAIRKGGIEFFEGEGVARGIPDAPATALSFSPRGDRLAAALPAEKRTILRLFDARGKLLGEGAIPEKVTSLVWRNDGQILAEAVSVTGPASAKGVVTRLYLWDGSTTPSATLLSETPLPPSLVRLPEEALAETLTVAVSPYGDEIAYNSLKCPPAFAPCQTIQVRHLETGREWVIGRASVSSSGPLYTPDGEGLLVGDGRALTRRLSIPDGRESYAWPAAGRHAAVSPAGSYVFLDGYLYRNGRTVTTFPAGSRGAFLADGSALAVSSAGKLYLVSGLKEEKKTSPPLDAASLLRLRRWRSLGLISEREYRGRKAGLP